ncbi:amino acid adenylation domain-containing protein [Lysobacter enzymogenes]|nr:non-ribosomal peptide synthetase [Lysobacter enzymogenes]QCW26357.1 amino acid adenylation domain-containing protein [Lysobacter enzymogenes]
MRLSAQAETELAQAGLAPLRAEQGVSALRRAWASGESCVTVLAGEDRALGELLDSFERREPPAAANLQAPERAAEEPAVRADLSARVLQRLIGVFAEVSKIAPARIDPQQALEAFSIDSIMIAQLNQRLAGAFPGLSKTLFYQFRNLAEIGAHLVAEQAQACARWAGADEGGASGQAQAPRERTVAAAAPANVRRAPSPSPSREPIAIVGLAGRYPDARDLDQFWRNLRAGRDSIAPIPAQRWPLEGFFCEDPERAVAGRMSYSKWGGFLDGFAEFDPLFFGIAPAQALDMDPQERLFLQACWQALEDSNHTRDSLARRYGGRVGVFAGITKTGFELHGRDLAERGDPATPYTSFSSVANRVSYLLDLNGPSFPIDTMCSASLTAIHEACEHLLRGECELALAGGVNLYLHPSTYVGLCSQRMLSTDGRCRSFGADATGFVPGEGVGVVVLKPLSAAERDGDRIHGVVLASGINHGGRTHGYTVPNPRAQRDLVRDTLARAGIGAGEIGCVEAHGTGTAMGDPIEIEGLAQAFAATTADTGFCSLGSVKSNIGHLEAAAGVAGLTKVLLQFRHGELAPTLHCERPNPNIDLNATPFVLQQRAEPWPRRLRSDGSQIARTATVSSFGAGGANAFVVVQEYPQSPPVVADTGAPALLVLSARRADRLAEYARRLADALERGGPERADLAAVAATLQLGREAMEHRLGFVATSPAQAIAILRRFAEGAASADAIHVGVAGRSGGDPVPAHTVQAWLREGRFEPVLAAWAAGAAVDWSVLYPQRPSLAALPTYPFAEEHYWPVAAQPRGSPGRAAARANRRRRTGALEPTTAAISDAGSDCLLVPHWQAVAQPAGSVPAGDLLVINATAAQLRGLSTLPAQRAIAVDWNGGGALERSLAGRAIAKIVWFAPASLADGWDSLLQAPAQAVEQCAALLQALHRTDPTIELVAVTRCGQSVDDDEAVDPAQAAVAGFLRSAAKDYRHSAFALVDLARGNGQGFDEPGLDVLASLRAVPGRATVYAHRHDGWRRSALVAVERGGPAAGGFRRGGVYVLVGGAGRVGRHVTDYLLSEHAATVIWVGRRPAGEVDAVLAGFAAAQRPLYYQADASDLDALRQVRAAVLARCGRIDAVLVATTHFSLAPAARLSSAELQAAFDAKTAPAVRIAQAFGGDAPGGLVFFSSLVSFIGNREQSHYAAACAWQDAFARLLGQRFGVPAKTLNWGYWTIDDPRRTRELHEIGIEFIDAASGGAALQALLSGPCRQLGFLRTHRSLEVEGLDPDRRLRIDGGRIEWIDAGAQAGEGVPALAAAASHDPFALDEFVRAALAREVCGALRMAPELLDAQAMFADYGVDSIIGLRVVRAINQALGIALAATCLFDHPNLDKLAVYVLQAHRAEALRAMGAQVPSAQAQAPAAAEPAQAAAAPRSAAPPQREPIAVIGMSGRFAQSDDSAELWRHLAAGRDLIEPASRWPDAAWPGDGEEPVCRHAGFVRDIDRFDPLFFRISRADAAYMDPQQRLCLEESWKALEAAGYAGRAVAGKKCGVYVGCSGEDYTQLLSAAELPAAAMHGSSTALLSSRIAYHLDLRGPAMTVDTACSSGLVAVHLACQALWMGEIELAIAGGVHVQCTHWFHLIGSRAGMLSPQGRCFAFDARANGFVPSDGVGMVVLKKLSAALADGDHIVGVIAGSAINQDGTSNGLTAPSAVAQEQLELEVYERFGIDVEQIQMAEAHGTGTALGDPIEFQALTRAFRRRTARRGFCAIGSVKSNLGHAAEAAGMAGLFKVLLSLQHRQIPPTLHFRDGNPHIDFADSPFYVNTALRDWPAPERGPRRHAQRLRAQRHQRAPGDRRAPARPATASAPWLLALSARSPSIVRQPATPVAGPCERPELDCMQVGYTLLQGRQHFEQRWACVASSAAEAVAALESALAAAPGVAPARPDARELDALGREAAHCLDAAAWPHERRAALQGLGALFVRGATPDFAPLFGPAAPRAAADLSVRARTLLNRRPGAATGAVVATVAAPSVAAVAYEAGDDPASFIGGFLERALALAPGELTADADLHDLGADSLVSMRLMREIGHRYGLEVSGRELFEHPSLAGLAAYVDARLANRAAAAAAAAPQDSLEALLDRFEAGQLDLDAAQALIEARLPKSARRTPARSTRRPRDERARPAGGLSARRALARATARASAIAAAAGRRRRAVGRPAGLVDAAMRAAARLRLQHSDLPAPERPARPAGAAGRVHRHAARTPGAGIGGGRARQPSAPPGGRRRRPAVRRARRRGLERTRTGASDAGAPARTVHARARAVDARRSVLARFRHRAAADRGPSHRVRWRFGGRVPAHPVPRLRARRRRVAAGRRARRRGARFRRVRALGTRFVASGRAIRRGATGCKRCNTQGRARRRCRWTGAAAHLRHALGANAGRAVAAACARLRITPAAFYLTLYQQLLAAAGGRAGAGVGMAVERRPHRDFDATVGCFVNLIVVPGDREPRAPLAQRLRRTHERLGEALSHADYPFPRVARELRRAGQGELFDTVFEYKNRGFFALPALAREWAGVRFEPVEGLYQEGEYPLAFKVAEREDGPVLYFDHDAARVPEATAEAWLEQLAASIHAALASLAEPVAAAAWRALPHTIQAQARRDPAALAAVDADAQLSYGELDARSDAIAAELRRAGVGADAIVGLLLERSNDALCALLGVWKSGAAYLALDPQLPAERLRFMIEDAGATTLIVREAQSRQLPCPVARTLVLERIAAVAAQERAAPAIDPGQLAYVVYTSGSTGAPKGVALTHAGLANLAQAQAAAFGVGAGERVLQFAPWSFDASVWEIAMAWSAGATLYLAPNGSLQRSDRLAGLMSEARIAVATLPPSALTLLDATPLPHLRILIVAGEECTPALAQRWMPRCRFVNAYGPSETTVCATFKPCDPERADTFAPGSVPIGRAIANTDARALDPRTLQPVAAGEVGELFVAGAALARGYLEPRHSPPNASWRILTARRAHMYTHWRPRARRRRAAVRRPRRRQIKIRGSRVRLDEVEAAAQSHPGVARCAVALWPAQRLVAFAVTGPDAARCRRAAPAHRRASAGLHGADAGRVPGPAADHRSRKSRPRRAAGAPARPRPQGAAGDAARARYRSHRLVDPRRGPAPARSARRSGLLRHRRRLDPGRGRGAAYRRCLRHRLRRDPSAGSGQRAQDRRAHRRARGRARCRAGCRPGAGRATPVSARAAAARIRAGPPRRLRRHHRHLLPVAGRPRPPRVLGQLARGRGEHRVPRSAGPACGRRARDRAGAAGTGRRARRDPRQGLLRRRVLPGLGAGRAGDGPATAPVAAAFVESGRGRRLPHRRDRRRRRVHERRQRRLPRRRRADAVDADGKLQAVRRLGLEPARFDPDPDLAPARPARPQPVRAQQLFVVAGGAAHRVPQPARRRRAPRPGRRGDAVGERVAGLCRRARHELLQRRPPASVRRRRRRHARRRRRRGGAAQARARGHRRRRSCLCAAARHGGQQRRRRQGRLLRAQRRRTGAGDRARAERQRRGRGEHRLHRGPRHRHPARRSAGTGGAGPGLRPPHRAPAVLRHRLGQEQPRTSRHRGRSGRLHQGRVEPAPWRDPAVAELRAAESGHRFRPFAVLCGRPPHAVAAARDAAPRRGEFVRHRRYQRPCAAGTVPRAGAGGA